MPFIFTISVVILESTTTQFSSSLL